MVAVGHGVDHGDIGMLRQFFKEADILVPDDKGVGPKTEIAAYILQRLFFIQGFRREQDGLAAQQGCLLYTSFSTCCAMRVPLKTATAFSGFCCGCQ